MLLSGLPLEEEDRDRCCDVIRVCMYVTTVQLHMYIYKILSELSIQLRQPRGLLHKTVGRSVQQGLSKVEGKDDPATACRSKVSVQHVHVLMVTGNNRAQF